MCRDRSDVITHIGPITSLSYGGPHAKYCPVVLNCTHRALRKLGFTRTHVLMLNRVSPKRRHSQVCVNRTPFKSAALGAGVVV